MFHTQASRFIAIGGLLLAAAAFTGCNKDKGEGSGTAGGSAAKSVAAAPSDLGAINGAVPESLAGALSFTTATIDDELDAVVPDGWEPSRVIPGSYSPPAQSGFGFFTKYKVGSNCDGMCEAKDWAPIVEKVEFGQLEGATIVKDEALDGGRLVVAKAEDRVRVIAAWWKSDARQYFYCRAELDGPARDAIDAFEKACRATRPRW